MRIDWNKIERLAVKKGLCATALADRATVSRTTMSTLKVRNSCTIGTAEKIAKTLNVEIEEIMPD